MNVTRDQLAWLSTRAERVSVKAFKPKTVVVIDTQIVTALMKAWAAEQKEKQKNDK